MARCRSCSAEIPESSRFCLACGAALSPPNSQAPTVAMARGQTPTPSGASFDEGRFPAGAILGDRYRILGLLGQGGMGEVYRAHDQILNQAVALKFLAGAQFTDAALNRFRNEVRLARQVSHPNVCRVYDIGVIEGMHFLTMEYVDGEDLRSLLRRIGRLSGDKALEIARRLCAGLAAAHDKGVLHRDLKPANIMLDGRGQVLITDFGLAGLAGQVEGGEIRNGTPAYMAPEQLAGKEVSVRSDIYSLGLVLHEMFTGKRVFEDGAQSEEKRSTPTNFSSTAKDIDPAVERIILRCLDAEPRNRPSSALAVAAALPGGDPLAAALAAGETPTPGMVAAAGDTEGISVKVAGICLGVVVAGLVAVAVLGSKTNILQKTPFDKPPAALEQKARDLIQSFGYTEPPVDRVRGFSYDTEFQQYGEQKETTAVYRAQLAKGWPALIRFWYRQSPQYLATTAPNTPVTLDDPPPIQSGMVTVILDPQGRLTEFAAVPPQVEKTAALSRAPDWAGLFSAAGLDMARFTLVDPEWLPLVSFDARAAWTGVFPDTDLPLRIEVASWRGKPVSFEMVASWSTPSRMQPVGLAIVPGIIVTLALLGIAALLAWRSLRLGRGDRRGAFRLAVFVFAVAMLEWLCGTNHVPTIAEFIGFVVAVSAALLVAGFFWMVYMALEPYVRRRWPQSLIGWSRLLGGAVRDPVVGGNLLIGAVFGVATAAVFLVHNLVLDVDRVEGNRLNLDAVLDARHMTLLAFQRLLFYIGAALVFFLLFFLLRALLRSQWLAAAVVMILVMLFGLSDSVNHPVISAALNLVPVATGLLVTIRFGVLAIISCYFTSGLLVLYPSTTDFSTWYAGSTIFAFVVVLALTAFAFHTAVAGRPLFKAGFLDPN
jgi:predicted Ser/Thr protein kinase